MKTQSYLVLILVGVLVFFLSCIPFFDETPPEVSFSTPANGESNYPPALSIVINFSEGMDRFSTENAFSITPELEGYFEWQDWDSIMKFFPDDYLEEDHGYSISIDTTAQDKAGNLMLNKYEMSFSTAGPISPISGGCDTAEIGSYYVAVFNGNDYGWSEETCDFRSAVYPYSRDKGVNKILDESSNYSDILIELRANSQPPVSKDNYDNIKQSYNSINPDDYVIGQTYNISGGSYKLKYKLQHCFLWINPDDDDEIEDTDTNGDGVSLEDYAEYFNNNSWDAIVNNFTGTSGWNWGSYPNEIIHIMFEDDDSSNAGWFDPYDLPLNAIHINTNYAKSGIGSNGQANPLFTNGTMTHEFHHLAHAQSGYPFTKWLNELCSSSAETIWSGQGGLYIDFFNDHNHEFNNISLLEWNNDIGQYYSVASLFGTWLSFQSKQGSDKGRFFRKLYQNKNFDNDDLKKLIKTADDVGIFNGYVNYNDSNSVMQAWKDIYADFVAALMLNEDYGAWGFNGAWDDPDVNAKDPWSGQMIFPEVYYYEPSSINIDTSGFAFFKVHKRITETDNVLVYDAHEVRE